jgi:tRNA uridine 5-carbamoylmethylation protein Kti12
MSEQETIVVVSGIPGAGKSTVAPLLARTFERAAYIEADRLQQMIVAGGRWPDQAPLEEGARQLRLRGTHACLLAKSFSAAGFVAVIDDIVIGDRLDHYRVDLAPRPFRLVQLLPSLDVVKARNLGRTAKNVFDQWQHLDEVARATAPDVAIDSSALDPEQTVAAIRTGLGL